MNQDIICHFSPTGGIDDKIAAVLNDGYSKEDIGTLRGLYDMDHKNKPLVIIPEGADETKMFSGQDVLEAAQKLMEYKSSQAQRHLNEMKDSTSHMAKTFNRLYHVPGWNVETRRNRINMIVSEFTNEVSRRMAAAKKAGISLTRSQIVNGYKSNGQFHEGQLSVFESIFDKFLAKYNEARETLSDADGITDEELRQSYIEENEERAEDEKWTDKQIEQFVKEDRQAISNAEKIVTEYPKIFQNWSALCAFARMSLRDTESLKLGQTFEYAAPASPDNFSMDSPLEDTYDLEESVREAWMTHQSETSAYGSLGAEVRRFLATITDVDAEGNKMTDDLGYQIKMDPLEMHQYLADILRGITSESSMIRKLRALSENDPRIKAVFDALAKASQADLNKSIDNSNKPKNPVILTQLLIDMHKNMVPYSALLKTAAGNVYAKILNRQANPLHDEFILRMQLNQAVDPANSIYDREGKVDWEKLAQWNAESATLLPAPEKKETSSTNLFASTQVYNGNGQATGFWALNHAQRIDYMKRAATALGIPMTDKAARRIYNNATLRKAYLTALQEFRTTTREVHSGDVLKDLRVLEKYNGIMPSVNAGFTAEQRAEYVEALNRLKERNISYKSFREKKYKSDKNPKSKGAGNERINKMLDSLADVSNYLKTERRVSWFDRKGKANSRYSDRTPSYMGDLVDKIHEFINEGDREGLQSFIEDKWGHSSFFAKNPNAEHGQFEFYNRWLQEMYDSIRTDTKGNIIIDPDAMAKVFEFDEFLGSNIDKQVSIFENFTEKQHAEAMMKQFVQMLDQSHGKSKLAKYPCFILGDSGAQMFFTAKRYSKAEIMEGLKDVFKQEIERMKYVKATNEVLEKGGFKTIDNFSDTANEFTMMKFFNPDYADGKYWKILTGNQDMTDAELKSLSQEEAIDMAKKAIGTDALTDALQQYMDDAKADFMKKLASVGVLAENKGEGGVITYTDPKGYFSQNIKWFDNSIDKLVEDFYWNTKYATIQQLQMFTVDPAFYDHRYPIKDLQKRYKEIYAPGKGVSIEARDFDGNLFVNRNYETAVYFDDIAVSSEDVNPYFMSLMKKTFGENSGIAKAYKKNTLTDGQGYRSLESYRAVKGMAGEWTRPMEEAYKRIKAIRNSGRELTEEDVKEIAQLAVIFQPIKPYLYTLEKLQINDSGDMALIPVQHKYAEIVLIPELMQDGKLKDMAKWMEENDVDLVASTKCVKVGAFGSAELKGANSTQSIYDALGKGYVHKLSWSDYRIQSGVPEHLNHAQLFGTQIRKLILANINKGNNYDYLNNILGVKTNDPLGPTVYLPGMGNVHLTGRNLISFYNCLVMANLFDSYNKFSRETSTNQVLSDKMIQNVISNTNQSEDNAFGFSLIDDGEFKGEFVIPLGEPGMEHDASALLYSLFKKNVNKQKIKGGSAVQASAMGLRGYDESGELFEMVSPEGDNVLYDEIEMPFNLSYTSPNKKDVSLKFEDWCYTEVTDDGYGHHEIGDLKLSGRIVYGEEAREYLSWPVSGRNKDGRPNQVDENGYDPNGYYVPLVEEKYKGILDIIAYRIPTERDYSMINCKVFRFSNPLAGGTMKVPSSRTTTAGFDFDIDKLYFFMREFAQTHLSDKQIEDIWSKIYGLKYDKDGKVIGGNELYEVLVEARNKDGIGKDLLSTASEMFKDLAGTDNLNQNLESRGRLFNYWEAAGLEGTPEEAFTKYLEDHRDEYPVFDTYNPAVSPLQNSRVSRNNMLIDLIRQRLMDKETLKARYTPGGFDNNRDAALRMRVLQHGQADVEVEGQHVRIIRDGKVSWPDVDKYVSLIQEGKLKDPEPEYDPSDPTAILVYNQQNQVAGKLIGIFANQNTNHVYASTMEELTLREPIRFGNHTSRGLQDMLHAPEGIDVDTNVSEYLAASVDAVKDPVLNFLNLNLVTADAGALLARIGYTPQEIGLLFNQPIIRELCNYVANENVSTDAAITEMLKKYGGKNATLEKMVFDATQVTSDRLANNIISRRYNAGNDMTAAFKQGQLQVLWLFNEIMADTADVNSFVQCTRFTAANSVGSTPGDQIAQEERVSNFIEKYMKAEENEKGRQANSEREQKNTKDPRRLSFKLFDESETLSNRVIHAGEANMFTTNQGILNIDERLLDLSPEEYMAQMSRNPLAFEQCMMDLSRKNTRTLFKKHFPYYTQLYNNMRDVMRRLTKYGGLDADTSNSLHRDFMVFLLSKQKGSAFDGEALWPGFGGRSGFTNRQFYKEVFPELLVTLKDNGVLANYPFFSMLNITGDSEMGLLSNEEEVSDGTSPNVLRISVQGMGGLQSRTSNLITEAWAQAFNSEDVVSLGGMDFAIKDLAEWCYYYNFYRLGYNFHPTSFINLAPTLLKLGLRTDTSSKENGYIDFINQVINGEVHLDASDLMMFAKQYMLNHLDNKKFVFSPKGHARSTVNNKAFNEAGGYWNNEFSISLRELGKDVASQFTVRDDSLTEGMTAFRPIIALERNGNIVYYMANSSEEKFNVVPTANGTMRYKQVYVQGIKGKSIQYFGNAAYEAFQNQGSLAGFKDTSSTTNPVDNRSNSNENTDGDIAPTPEGTHIEMGTDISSMFTDAEWQSMFNEFKNDNTALFSRDDMQGFDWVAFRQNMLDTNDSQNVEILNDLLKRIDRGEKMQTINDEGKPTNVC